jgi:hypothetical protein
LSAARRAKNANIWYVASRVGERRPLAKGKRAEFLPLPATIKRRYYIHVGNRVSHNRALFSSDADKKSHGGRRYEEIPTVRSLPRKPSQRLRPPSAIQSGFVGLLRNRLSADRQKVLKRDTAESKRLLTTLSVRTKSI